MKRLLIFFPAVILSISLATAQQTWHVDQQVAGGQQHGLDWPNAFPDLQQALALAQYGDAIWVAEGIYKPTADADRSKSFHLVNGVGLYGGFSGTEIQLSERNPAIHATILSGNTGQDSLKTDNSLHVLIGVGLDSSSVLDGFTITQGYSADTFSPYPYDYIGAGLLLLGYPNVANTAPHIVNCRFTGNAAASGGAIAIDWINVDAPGGGNNNYVNPVLRDCVFERNSAYLYGGAVMKKGPVWPGDTLLWENCRFLDNEAGNGSGGGIAILTPGSSALHLLNCTFERDSAWEGGGLFYSVEHEDSITTVLMIDSCRFERNVALNGGGITYANWQFFGSKASLFFHLTNSVFENNYARTTDGASFDVSGTNQSKLTAIVRNCLFRGNLSLNSRSAEFSAILGSEADITVADCTFLDNLRANNASGICFPLSFGAGGSGAPSKMTSRIYNCVFANNGGGISVLAGKENQVSTEITNCTFYKNNAYTFVKSWYAPFDLPGSVYYNNMLIRNCVLWEPGSTPVTMFYSNDPQNLNCRHFDVDYSLINFSEGQLGTLAGSDMAFGEHNLYATDPEFAAPDSGDFRLKLCSEAVNHGTNPAIEQLGALADLDGLPRIRFGFVDLGAYETQDSCIELSAGSPLPAEPLLISPNPSTGLLRFELPDAAADRAVLWIFNEKGGLVHRTSVGGLEAVSLYLGWLRTGIYVVKLTGEKVAYTGKWMKL